MHPALPIVLRLPPALLVYSNPFPILLARAAGVPSSLAAHYATRYAFRNDELRFARELIGRKSNLWLYRCDQRAFCGDFVVVDMSSADPTRRVAVVLDLKQGAALREGGGGAGLQFRNAARAVTALGVLPAEGACVTLLAGDRRAVLERLAQPRLGATACAA